MTEQFLNTHQVARRLGINYRVAQKWMREGTLPAFKMGKCWRMSEGELVRWMDNKKKIGKIMFVDVPVLQYERQ
jgi:excisionase family DNA binding protein